VARRGGPWRGRPGDDKNVEVPRPAGSGVWHGHLVESAWREWGRCFARSSLGRPVGKPPIWRCASYRSPNAQLIVRFPLPCCRRARQLCPPGTHRRWHGCWHRRWAPPASLCSGSDAVPLLSIRPPSTFHSSFADPSDPQPHDPCEEAAATPQLTRVARRRRCPLQSSPQTLGLARNSALH